METKGIKVLKYLNIQCDDGLISRTLDYGSRGCGFDSYPNHSYHAGLVKLVDTADSKSAVR